MFSHTLPLKNFTPNLSWREKHILIQIDFSEQSALRSKICQGAKCAKPKLKIKGVTIKSESCWFINEFASKSLECGNKNSDPKKPFAVNNQLEFG